MDEQEEEIRKMLNATYYSLEDIIKMKKRSENDGDETDTEAEKSSDEDGEGLIEIDKII